MGAETLGSLAANVTRRLRGDFLDQDGQQQIRDDINAAIASIWMTMMLVTVRRIIGADSPVTLSLASGIQSQNLVAITDPTNLLTFGAVVAGGALGARSYQMQFTYVTESGSETLPCPLATTAVTANHLAQVVPPAAVAQAIGWNLYAGINELALQNQQPLPFGINAIEPAVGFQDYPTYQQVPPTTNSTADNLSYIKHLEVPLPDQNQTLYQAWNQYDLDSGPMRKAARTYSSSSPYQLYVWDLINGKQLQFRPVLGTAFTARYWYIVKPRRLRYDQAEIPFQQITGVQDFIMYYALKMAKLTLEEYLAAEGWDAQVDKKRMEIEMSLLQENWNADQRVTPFMY